MSDDKLPGEEVEGVRDEISVIKADHPLMGEDEYDGPPKDTLELLNETLTENVKA